MNRFCPGITISRDVILFSVSVPVLSEQIADVEPRVSTAGSRFTIAFRRAISRVPIDSSAVTTAGRPVGIAATASATPVMNSVSNASPRMQAERDDEHQRDRRRSSR